MAGVVAGLETIPAIMSQYGTGLLTLDKTILGILGITPDVPLVPEDLAGLPLPERIWD